MTIYKTADQPAGTLIAENFAGWSPELRAEFARNEFNGRVGQRLLSETDRVRVWEIRVKPGQRVAAHRHVLDYFWSAVSAGTSVQHTSDGTTRRVEYQAGDTVHFRFGDGEYLLHDLQNAGPQDLRFVTVEFLSSANKPLEITRLPGEEPAQARQDG
jgi:hypothetical protein